MVAANVINGELWGCGDMRLTDFLTDVAIRQVQYYPELKPILGSATATILFGQLLYWTGKTADAAGWIYKSQVELEKETGLTREEQEGARKKLKASGVLHEQRRGIPARLWFRLDLDVVNKLWEVNFEKNLEEKQQIRQIPQTCSGQSRKQACGKAANKNAGNPQATTDTTSDSTAETTIPEAIMDLIPSEKRTSQHLATLSAALAVAGGEVTADNIRRALKAARNDDPWGMTMEMLRELAHGKDWYKIPRKQDAAKTAKQAADLCRRQEEAETKRLIESQQQAEFTAFMELFESFSDAEKDDIRAAAKHECQRLTGTFLPGKILDGAIVNITAERYPNQCRHPGSQ